jgi:hypothetical protein
MRNRGNETKKRNARRPVHMHATNEWQSKKQVKRIVWMNGQWVAKLKTSMHSTASNRTPTIEPLHSTTNHFYPIFSINNPLPQHMRPLTFVPIPVPHIHPLRIWKQYTVPYQEEKFQPKMQINIYEGIVKNRRHNKHQIEK